MTERKIVVELCTDHFKRLCDGDVCDSCPSRIHGEVSNAVITAERNDIRKAIVKELGIIRRSINDLEHTFDERTTRLEHLIKGNGSTGIQGRVEVIEARLESRAKSIAMGVTVIGVILSVLISLFTLLVEFR